MPRLEHRLEQIAEGAPLGGRHRQRWIRHQIKFLWRAWSNGVLRIADLPRRRPVPTSTSLSDTPARFDRPLGHPRNSPVRATAACSRTVRMIRALDRSSTSVSSLSPLITPVGRRGRSAPLVAPLVHARQSVVVLVVYVAVLVESPDMDHRIADHSDGGGDSADRLIPHDLRSTGPVADSGARRTESRVIPRLGGSTVEPLP
jgi:hypothetical protein